MRSPACWRVALTLVAGAATLACLGCTRPATQLIVVVDTDLPSDAYACFGLLVAQAGESGTEPATRRFLPASVSGLPFSFGVTPPDGDARHRVEVAVEALPGCEDPPMDARIVRRAVRTGFVEGQRLRLSLFLPASCGEGCTTEQTCAETGASCVPVVTVEPEDLVPTLPGEELLDAGSTRPDAVVEPDAAAPPDAIVADAAPPPPPRLIAPLSTATATSRRPTLRWENAPGVDGALVELCRDRTCTDMIGSQLVSGTSARPAADLEVGATFWRVRGHSGPLGGGVTGSVPSATWEVFVGAQSAPVDTSWGTTLDVNGDGLADLATSAPFAPAGGRVYVHPGAPGSLEAVAAVVATGSEAGDWFGWAVASAGDLDGDGYGDLAIGAPAAASALGRVYVFRGGPTGLESVPGATVTGTAADLRAGWSVVSAGDVNGDGYGDLAVGTSLGTGATPGEVYVHHGGPAGIEATPSLTLRGPDGMNDQFGHALASGDLDGDGFSDLVVGAFRANRVHVFAGGPGGLPTTPTVSLTGPDAGSFGVWIASAGDVDADGFADVAVGATGVSSGVGRAYVHHGGAAGLASAARTTVNGAAGTFAYFANALAFGDFDGDGHSDLVVGASNADRAFSYRGTAGGLSTAPAWMRTGPDGADGLYGQSVAAIGDVDGDGLVDLAVGAPFVMAYTGRVYVYPGGASGPGTVPIATLTGTDGGIARFGYALAGGS